jgi:hypothetical protein
VDEVLSSTKEKPKNLGVLQVGQKAGDLPISMHLEGKYHINNTHRYLLNIKSS